MTARNKGKVRKPKELENDKEYQLYANFMASTDTTKTIYVGGRYYEDWTQMHLTTEEAKKLHTWLGKAIKYLESRKK